MRCLQIVDSFTSAGGMERFIYNFSQLLERNGVETVVAADEVEEAPNWGDFEVQTVSLGGSITQWERQVAEFSPDLVIWHAGPQTSVLAEKLSQQYTVVSTVHGVLCPAGSRLYRDRDEICYRTAGPGCYVRWYLRHCGSSASPFAAAEAMQTHKQMMKALRSCHRVYAVSRAIENFLTIEGVLPERIRVFDNTLGSLKDLPPLQSPRSAGRVSVLYVGRLVYAKGPQYVIQATRLLLDRGIDIECRIAGDGWYSDKLHDLVGDLNLLNHVRFVGKIPGSQMNKWYSESDLVVVPSIWPDPAPLVVPEARMMGKPVIVFNAGGLPEWAEIMDGIVIADHASAESLADKVISILDKAEQPISPSRFPASHRVDLVQDLSGIFAIP